MWQRSMALVQEIYRVTGQFPGDERYGLTAQLRRSAVSVPSNIAEGHERGATRDFMRYLAIAEGSLAEARTQLRIGLNLGYCSPGEIERIFNEMTEIKRMLYALRRSLHDRQSR
ncbi:MAG TPA: four helix bundle protein [Thermoanaerobaculia bacterium]|nr:four helix bundle protein [Thermoanaerobaculia bacterium]